MAIELLIEGRPRDLGGFSVRRVLPAVQRRLVGPFIFFDHMGPADFAPGVGFDVRPHPHVGLATVTYLFAGEMQHKDSVGSDRVVRPGDVNWMIAGRGIAHSERATAEGRKNGLAMHGIQSWVALPLEHEETEPRFEHHPRATLPHLSVDGASLDVIAGTAYGKTSPVGVLSPTIYVHARLDADAELPVDDGHEERAVYVVEGRVRLGEQALGPGALAVLEPGARVRVVAEEAARVMLLGGAHLEGRREIYWNFVASSKERIERAKDDWKNRRFPIIPGDDVELIPLPEV
ncbi:MAG: pirin family protein [Labilithrix sp.]|nr:pirin family protein [Labilithrix sp.]MCW5814997.1 pirin family protein [Labilithrix sp.]